MGGPSPGSLPPQAVTIFGEGIAIPPVKLYREGELQEEILELILNNVREPALNKCDLMALVAGCRVGEQRIIELCDRFGKETYVAAIDALLERTRVAMEHLIRHFVPEQEATSRTTSTTTAAAMGLKIAAEHPAHGRQGPVRLHGHIGTDRGADQLLSQRAHVQDARRAALHDLAV